jgi:hypothetical protein
MVTAPPSVGDALLKSIPFSRLSLEAQFEVLDVAPAESWNACVGLNPFLVDWRRRSATGTLRVSPWPEQADRCLGAEAYARRFARLIDHEAVPLQRGDKHGHGVEAQKDFLKAKFSPEYQYPLLWRTAP